MTQPQHTTSHPPPACLHLFKEFVSHRQKLSAKWFTKWVKNVWVDGFGTSIWLSSKRCMVQNEANATTIDHPPPQQAPHRILCPILWCPDVRELTVSNANRDCASRRGFMRATRGGERQRGFHGRTGLGNLDVWAKGGRREKTGRTPEQRERAHCTAMFL